MSDLHFRKVGNMEYLELDGKVEAVYKNYRGVLHLWDTKKNDFVNPPSSDDEYDFGQYSSDDESDEEEKTDSPQTPPPKKPHPLANMYHGKPTNADWRHRPDGTYDNRPNDPDYFKKYMKTYQCKKVRCTICQNELFSRNLGRHQRTSKTCLKIRALLEQQKS